MNQEDERTKVGRYWDRMSRSTTAPPVSWGMVPAIKAHISERYCGKPLPNHFESDRLFIQDVCGRSRFDSALSIACGEARKELALVKSGFISHITLCDLSSVRLDKARALAESFGVSERVSFTADNLLESSCNQKFDLVYWSHALHHMPDVSLAIDWSRRACKSGGAVFGHEWVGGNRLQWRQHELDAANAIRELLEERYFEPVNGRSPPRQIASIPEAAVAAADPSEATDSEAILPAFHASFAGGDVVQLGGVIWHLALKGLLENFKEPEDDKRMAALLALDGILADSGMSAYAVFCGRLP